MADLRYITQLKQQISKRWNYLAAHWDFGKISNGHTFVLFCTGYVAGTSALVPKYVRSKVSWVQSVGHS